jgi:dihydroxyacetone kinase-like predicted kinase
MTSEKLEVSVHISTEIRGCLQHYQDEQNVNMASSAVEIILDEYFRMRGKSGDVLSQKFRGIEEKVTILSRQIDALTAAIYASNSIKTKSITDRDTGSIYAEIEDEPCETLTSFLES